tara:strand:+ start:67 stop:405 length:339 start_codon:yes stop_codon:yes gene_type:complete
MASKKLEPNSEYSQFDKNNDGVVSDEELEFSRQLEELKLSSEKADAQRAMAWFALWGMLLYPTLIVVCSLIGLDKAASILSEIASVYFVAISALVAAYFSASAWVTRGKNGK